MTRAQTVRDKQVRGLLVRHWKTRSVYALQREFKGETVVLTLGDVRLHSVKEARTWALKLQALFAQGIDPRRERSADPSIPKLGTAWAARLEWLERYRRPSTVLHSRQYQAKFTDWLDMPITDITTDMIRKRHAEISVPTTIKQPTRSGKTYDREVGGPVTANRAIKVFSETWNWTHEAMVQLPPCPVPKRYLMNPEKPKPKAMTADELIAWNEAVLAHPRCDLHLFTLFSGLRRRTLLNLRWDWMGWYSIEIPADYMKAGRPFRLPLSPTLMEILQRVPRTEDRIFPYSGIRSKSLPAYGHRLRHTYRTVAMLAGVPEVFIDMLMDHKVSADIGKVYTNPETLFEQLLKHQTEIDESLLKMVAVR